MQSTYIVIMYKIMFGKEKMYDRATIAYCISSEYCFN